MPLHIVVTSQIGIVISSTILNLPEVLLGIATRQSKERNQKTHRGNRYAPIIILYRTVGP